MGYGTFKLKMRDIQHFDTINRYLQVQRHKLGKEQHGFLLTTSQKDPSGVQRSSVFDKGQTGAATSYALKAWG